jgi:hypothetical protein
MLAGWQESLNETLTPERKSPVVALYRYKIPNRRDPIDSAAVLRQFRGVWEKPVKGMAQEGHGWEDTWSAAAKRRAAG